MLQKRFAQKQLTINKGESRLAGPRIEAHVQITLAIVTEGHNCHFLKADEVECFDTSCATLKKQVMIGSTIHLFCFFNFIYHHLCHPCYNVLTSLLKSSCIVWMFQTSIRQISTDSTKLLR